MKKLYVYADFDWLKEVELIGELGYESLRGADSYSFTFNNEWLRQHSDLFLSDDLNNYPGQQYTQPGKDIFGCFSDALPDRWGRTLLLRREQIVAAEEQRPVRRLSSFDFLTGIDDFSRMGGFRFHTGSSLLPLLIYFHYWSLRFIIRYPAKNTEKNNMLLILRKPRNWRKVQMKQKRDFCLI